MIKPFLENRNSGKQRLRTWSDSSTLIKHRNVVRANLRATGVHIPLSRKLTQAVVHMRRFNLLSREEMFLIL